MSPDTLLQHFDAVADAPNGVPKLRELILQLAVQGKLVPQNLSDEPASVLLERIKAEKQRLHSAGEIRKIISPPPLAADEQPYGLPKGWSWVRVGDVVFSISGGATPSKQIPRYWDGGIPWASVKDLSSAKYLTKTQDFISEQGLASCSTTLVPPGRVVVCTRMGLGKIAINQITVTINQDLKALEIAGGVNVNYFYEFYRAQDITGSGMTVSGIKQNDLLNLPLPLPPSTEQRRIVEKVDQLMALCDEMEERQQRRAEARVRLNRASLHHLTAATDDAEVAEHWQRISDNFHLLYDAPETVSELRQAILQLAVRGKLVPQDPRDEPASALLEQIESEKQRLFKEGKIGKPKPLSPVKLGEVPFELPEGWEWIHLDGAFAYITDGDHQPPPRAASGIPFLVIGDVSGGSIDFSDPRFVLESYYDKLDNVRKPAEGDVLYTVTGSYGIPLVVNTDRPFCVQRHIAILKSASSADVQFLYWLLRSRLVFEQATERATGIAQKTVSLGVLRTLLVPFPPLAEQRRIVEKVDQLMELCDGLDATLARSRTRAEKLASAVVHHLTAA